MAPRQTWKDRTRRAWLARIVVAIALAAMGIWAPAALAGTADLVVTAHANRQVTLRPCSVLECRRTSLQLRVSVRNRGPDPAQNVALRLSGLDDREDVPTIDCTAAGAATADTPPGCSFATIAPRARVTVRFRFSVCCPFGQPDETMTHGAAVTADTADPDHANDAAFAVTRVVVAQPKAPKPDHRLPTVRVLVLDFDPLTDAGVPLSRAQGWNDPVALTSRYAADAGVASAGLVRHRIVRWTTVRSYPVKGGGFVFTNPQFLACLSEPRPDVCTQLIDYGAVLNTVYDPAFGSACQALAQGRVNEVFLWGGPFFGFLEFRIVAPRTLCADVDRQFAVMGFNDERGAAEAVHDLGHRAEAQIQAGIGLGLWDRFDGQRARYAQDFACPPAPDAAHPEVVAESAGAGNVHFPPNAYCHFQYDRDLVVQSDADDWALFPNLTGRRTPVSARTWGATQEGYLIWWLGRLPRNAGSTAGVAHDWWRYIYPARESAAVTPAR